MSVVLCTGCNRFSLFMMRRAQCRFNFNFDRTCEFHSFVASSQHIMIAYEIFCSHLVIVKEGAKRPESNKDRGHTQQKSHRLERAYAKIKCPKEPRRETKHTTAALTQPRDENIIIIKKT